MSVAANGRPVDVSHFTRGKRRTRGRLTLEEMVPLVEGAEARSQGGGRVLFSRYP